MTRPTELSPVAVEKAPEFFAKLNEAERVLVASHENPDGDALGSSLALAWYLNERGIEFDVLNSSKPPEYLEFLPGFEWVSKEPKLQDHDLAVILDLGSLNRLGRVEELASSIGTMILVDHHVPTEQPGDFRIVDVESPATCAIVYDLFKQQNLPVSQEMATCLLAGIVTDTGGFRYPSTQPHTLVQAGELLATGANLAQVAEEVYQRKDLAAVRLQATAIDRMKMTENGRIAWSTLPRFIYDELGALEEHTEGIVNQFLSVKSVDVCALLRETADGQVKASLRSRNPYDIASVAQKFNGGGHVNAAGASFEPPITRAEQELVEALKECLD